MTISAKIITDSIGVNAPRLTTLQLRYPRFIHAEFMTHRQFSRNASSSRAVPVKKLIQDVIEDPVFPSFWGANKKGMQATEECHAPVLMISELAEVILKRDRYDSYTREGAWEEARDNAIKAAKAFDEAGYHKQIVNRLLEPFSHINVVVTATNWTNFFALRDHPAAQPEIMILAQAIKKAMDESKPKMLSEKDWHLPYITESDWMDIAGVGDVTSDQIKDLIKVSVARCARVSYLTRDGKKTTIEKDVELYYDLLGQQPIHASPAEHQARPDRVGSPDFAPESTWGKWLSPRKHGNLRGWVQYRKTLAGECQ